MLGDQQSGGNDRDVLVDERYEEQRSGYGWAGMSAGGDEVEEGTHRSANGCGLFIG
jgi:hypothetical protein